MSGAINPATCNQEELLRHVLNSLAKFKDDIATYVTRDSMFSSKVASEIKQIQSILGQTLGHLQLDFELLNGGADPISFLLSQLYSQLEDITTQLFRQSKLQHLPSPASQNDMLTAQKQPVYISQLPSLPHGATTCQIRVIVNNQEHVDRVADLSTIAQSFIHSVVNETGTDHYTGGRFLKAVGLDEWIYGEKKLSHFQCVREAVRKRQTLILALESPKLPDPAAVDRILDLGKKLRKSFIKLAGGSEEPEKLIVVANDDHFEHEFDLDAIQNQRLNKLQQTQENSLINNVHMHLDSDSSDEEIFAKSTTRSQIDTSVSRSHLLQQQQQHSTPSKSKNHVTSKPTSPQYGRDRTPSPERPIQKSNNAHLDAPVDSSMHVKIVPLSVALKKSKPQKFDLDEEEAHSKRISAVIHDIPDEFKRSMIQNSPDQLTDESTESEDEGIVTVENPKSMFGTTTTNTTTPSSSTTPLPTVVGLTTPTITTTIAPTEQLQIADFTFRDEIQQKRLVQERLNTSHTRNKSREFTLNDSDEEEFAAKTPRKQSITRDQQPSTTTTTSTSQQEPQLTTTPSSKTTTLQQPQTVELEVEEEEDVPMFGGAAKSPHKRMGRTSSVSNLFPPDSISQPDELKTDDVPNPIEQPPEEVMFGGAARSPHRRMAQPRGTPVINNDKTESKPKSETETTTTPITTVPPPPAAPKQTKMDLTITTTDDTQSPSTTTKQLPPPSPAASTPRSKPPPLNLAPGPNPSISPTNSTSNTPRSKPPPLPGSAPITPSSTKRENAFFPAPSGPDTPTNSIPGAMLPGLAAIPPPPTKKKSVPPPSTTTPTPDKEEDDEEHDQIAPLPAGPVSEAEKLKTTTPEQLLASTASTTLTSKSPNFFKAATPNTNTTTNTTTSISSTTTSTTTTSTTSSSNLFRRGSVAPTGGNNNNTLGRGSVFRFQNSTLGPGDMGELSAIAEQLNYVTEPMGALFSPAITTPLSHTIDYDDNESLFKDHRPAQLVVSVNDTHLPRLRLKVNGVDGINFATCPRLAQYQGYSKLYIASCLIAGDVILPQSVASTIEIDPSTAPRWDEYILPTSRPIPYNSLPRQTKVAFVLVARFTLKPEKEKTSDGSFNSNTDAASYRDVPLAWCCQQLFYENGHFISGKNHLPLWPLGFKGEDDTWDHISSALGASQMLLETTNEERIIGPTTIQDKAKEKKDKKEKKLQLEQAKMNPNLTKGLDFQLQAYLYRGVNVPNFLTEAAVLTVELDSFTHPLTIPHPTNVAPVLTIEHKQSAQRDWDALSRDEQFQLTILENEDALYTLRDKDKALIWSGRIKLTNKQAMAAKFVQSIPNDKRDEGLAFLNSWCDFKSLPHLIPLLDAQYQDHEIRRFAVERLKFFSLGHIQMYLLQLTQCIKFETYHNGPLSDFLLTLSVQHPNQIGHFFYWNLKNEMSADPPFALRIKTLLETFLTFCPMATEELRTQQQIIDECKRIASFIRSKKSSLTDKELETTYRDSISAFNRDFLQRLPNGSFKVPLDPRWEATSLIPEKCKIMSSKMAPLWLVFQNKDGRGPDPNMYVIFKAGDDVRQDILTLQILRFMDEVWLENKLDLRLSPYNVIATGNTEDGQGTGMIQVVLNSQTTAGIQRTYGGGASGAFQEDTIWQFLKEHNPTKEKLDAAVQNFQLSTAGYCVATYILGIGDRHNGNIMVTKDGHLFHIDFGHFLGNKKKKMGINRERADFVCTPEMIYAACGGSGDQSGQHFTRFVTLCLDAFSIMRHKAVELESLFVSMVSAGLPECLSKNAILWIRKQLALELTDKAAREMFEKELHKALNSTTRKIDNFLHLIKHSNKA